MALLEWLKAVPLPLAGTAYEPWVQLLQFLLIVAVFSAAIAWLLTRRHVSALAYTVVSLLKRTSQALGQASRYPPAVECHLHRYDPYVIGSIMLACYGGALVAVVACLIGIPSWALAYNLAGITWSNILVACAMLGAGVCLGHFCLVGVLWAWHSITTGEPFTWPSRHSSELPAP
jgi:hypothetical protein